MFDYLYDQNGYNSYYSNGNYEYVLNLECRTYYWFLVTKTMIP